MKKKVLLVVLAIAVILLGNYLLFRKKAPAPAAQQTPPAASVPAPPASDLPDLTITKLDNSQLRVKELKGKNILILFQPDCDHCQRETKDIKAHLAAFKAYTLYFVSNYNADQVRQFSRDYALAFEPNVVFATTPVEGILNTLGPQPSPAVYIYDEGRLVKSFLGETKVEQIIPFL
jgi:thiol-disulfide isomerase/thioredoxin